MKHAGYLWKFPHNGDPIGMGIPFMDDHRHIQLPGQSHLRPESFLLNFSGDILIMIVQTDFTDGQNFFI